MTDEGWFGASDAAATTSLVRFPARWVEPISFLQLIQLIGFFGIFLHILRYFL